MPVQATTTPEPAEQPDPAVFIAFVGPEALPPSGHCAFIGSDEEGLSLWVMLKAKDEEHVDFSEIVDATAPEIAADLLSMSLLQDGWSDLDLMTLIELRDGGGMLSADLIHGHIEINRPWYEAAQAFAA